ncbi:hypothetical protein ACFOSV_14885 [Algoriphagus namhaensis]|uniref:DUF4421 domain-containing protein n=1 Tax=Algoriphagus namhaensis TaxID=915353 RepID=A0ABV8AU00_9BACT
MRFTKYILFALSLLICSVSQAQEEDIFGISEKAKAPKSNSSVGNVFRNVLEQFSLEISGGAAYHQTKMPFYSETPYNFPFYQYQNFDNKLELTEETPIDMKSSDWAMPLNAGIRINLFSLLTIGGGYGREWGNFSNMRGGDHEFNFDASSYQVSKLYGTVGLVLYDAKRRQSFLKWQYRRYSTNNLYMMSELTQRARQVYPWRFILEAEFGQLDLKQSMDQYVSVSEDPYFGLGLRIERDFSEYTKMFVKGGAEFRSFVYSNPLLPEIQTLDQNVYALQVGFSVRFPGTKRCKIGGCGVVMKHMHNGVEYRGSGIFNYQNRKIGQWY